MSQFVQITLAPSNQTIQVPVGADLKEVLHRFGVEFPCGGRGRCGACRIKVIQGVLPLTQACASTLSKEETDAGWRFACRHRAEQDITFELGQREASVLTAHGAFSVEARDGTAVVIDLGTTTLVAQLLDLQSGQVLAVETALNPQAVHGADLMTRVDYGLREPGREKLMRSIREKLGELVQGLIALAPSTIDPPGCVLLAGNTAMHHLFCGLDLSPLSQPPFESSQLGARQFTARELGWKIHCDPEVVFLPCLGGFVGSDILAGILATQMQQSEELIGQFISSRRDEYFLASKCGCAVDAPVTARLSDGMACRVPEPAALELILKGVDRIVQVTDDEVAAGMRMMFECTHNVCEGAGAAALAAAIQEKNRIAGCKVAVIASGGNVDQDVFAGVLNEK